MANEGRGIQEVEGVEVIADLGTSLYVCWVDIGKLKEQDKNAQMMNPVMFEQLTANIKKRGMVESLPLCAFKDGVIEIVSGHHRTRASREAGLKRIPVLLDASNLSRSSIAAKQLAHNALNGFSDRDMVKEIAKLITDVDDMLEAYLSKAEIEVKEVDIGAMLYPSMDIDWREVSLLFLPEQFERFKDLVQSVGKKQAIFLAEQAKFKPFIDALTAYQKYQDIYSAGMAIDLLTRIATGELQEAGYTEEWQSIQQCVGGGSLPKADAEIIKKAVKQMKKSGEIPDKKPWMAVVKLCAQYLGMEYSDERRG